MRLRSILLGLSLVGVGIFLIYLGINYVSGNSSIKVTAAPSPNGGGFESRFDDQGAVAVEVRPIKIDTGKELQFEVSLNTHSVELDDDLTKAALLYDDQSHFYEPVKWIGSGPGGHHRSGTLIFGSLDSAPKYIELKIRDIGEVPLRIFKWELK